MTIYENKLPANVWQIGTPLSPEVEAEELVYYEGSDADVVEWHGRSPVDQRMMLILVFVVAGALIFGVLAVPRVQQGTVLAENASTNTADRPDIVAEPPALSAAAPTALSPIFTREVQFWSPQIVAWAQQYGLDPNMVATVMQIESCGDPQALSGAGAQGLFQVMPFHFQPGENAFDPDTNAFRGMTFLADLVAQFGEPGLAFAGYNGGPGNAVKAYSQWPAETQRYHTWASGIYGDTVAGNSSSETLDRWLAAGGAGGCARAATNLGLQ